MVKLKKYFTDLFVKTWVEAENQSVRTAPAQGTVTADMKVIIILVYTAIGIVVSKYFGHTTAFLDVVLVNPSRFDLWYCSFFFGSETGKFHSMVYWSASIIMFYLVIPVLIVRFVFREDLRDYGFRIRGVAKDYPLYVLMLAIMLPLVYLASTTQSFLDRYPLFQPSQGHVFPLFLYWQAAYFLQFVAVEFLFRGFMVHGMKHRFGVYAVFIMVIPYCLVHIGKPFGETMAAILAGIILGMLSLKSRSIILGIMIHYSIAISMDLFALWREGVLWSGLVEN